jgi:hypothetical protein
MGGLVLRVGTSVPKLNSPEISGKVMDVYQSVCAGNCCVNFSGPQFMTGSSPRACLQASDYVFSPIVVSLLCEFQRSTVHDGFTPLSMSESL